MVATMLRSVVHRLLEHSPRGRMLRGVASNLYDKGVIALLQLINIPILTHAWGTDGFGVWLMLTTLPTYVALSDIGFGTAAAVELTTAHAKGDHERARVTFESALLFNGGIGVAVAIIAAAVAIAIVMWQGSAGAAYSPLEFSGAIACIAGYSVGLVISTVATIAYRATHRFAFAMTFAGTVLLVEGIALIAAATMGLGLFGAAALMLVIRIASTYLLFALLRRQEPWARFSVAKADFAEIKRLSHPSLGAISLTVASAIALQGAVLVLGGVAGAAVTAVFASARSLTRMPLQFSGLVLRPTIPELTRAVVNDDKALAARLLRVNVGVALASSLPFVLIFSLFGPFLMEKISAGYLVAGWPLFFFLSLAGAANSTWMAIASPLVATNQYRAFSGWYFSLSLAVVGAPFIPIGAADLKVAAAYCAAEIATGLIVLRAARRRQ